MEWQSTLEWEELLKYITARLDKYAPYEGYAEFKNPQDSMMRNELSRKFREGAHFVFKIAAQELISVEQQIENLNIQIMEIKSQNPGEEK